MKWRQLALSIKIPPAVYTRPCWLEALLKAPMKKRHKTKYKQLPLKGLNDDND